MAGSLDLLRVVRAREQEGTTANCPLNHLITRVCLLAYAALPTQTTLNSWAFVPIYSDSCLTRRARASAIPSDDNCAIAGGGVAELRPEKRHHISHIPSSRFSLFLFIHLLYLFLLTDAHMRCRSASEVDFHFGETLLARRMPARYVVDRSTTAAYLSSNSGQCGISRPTIRIPIALLSRSSIVCSRASLVTSNGHYAGRNVNVSAGYPRRFARAEVPA